MSEIATTTFASPTPAATDPADLAQIAIDLQEHALGIPADPLAR